MKSKPISVKAVKLLEASVRRATVPFVGQAPLAAGGVQIASTSTWLPVASSTPGLPCMAMPRVREESTRSCCTSGIGSMRSSLPAPMLSSLGVMRKRPQSFGWVGSCAAASLRKKEDAKGAAALTFQPVNPNTTRRDEPLCTNALPVLAA